MKTFKQYILEVSPPGFEGTVKAMKKHKDIDNPYALAWYMKNKGYKSHKKEDGSDKEMSEERKYVDRVKKLAGKVNIQNTSSDPDGNNTMHTNDRKIGGNTVNMTAHHDKKRNTSKIDFSVNDEGTARTGKVGHKGAKRILNHVSAFIHKHHDNMGGGDHKTQFDAYKAGHQSANPNARAGVYGRLAKKASEAGFNVHTKDHGHKTTFTLSKEKTNV